jgi:D-alanyl-D-alanine carboxypeptidase
MKKVIVGIVVAVVLTVVLLAAFGVFGGVGIFGGVIVGSGNLTTKNFNLSDFTEVAAQSGFQLELVQSSTFSVEVTADDNVMDYINVNKSGNTLKIRPQWNRSFRSATLIAKITMPDLYEIKLSGGSGASISGFSSLHDLSVGLSGGSSVTGDITAGDAYFNLSGGSQVNLQGTADDLDVNGSGGSQLELEAFAVNNADVNLSGGGRATVNVNGTLDVNLSGGSHVIYVGEPTSIDSNLSGDSTIGKDEHAETRPELQASLEDAVQSEETLWPGALLRVSSPELGTWSGAAGLADIDEATPMQSNNRFRGGSLTKPFVSAVVLQLVEEGRFSLDDPMTSVLAENITSKFANSSNITVRMLLNHTGGIPEFLDLAMPHIVADLQRVWQDDEWLDFAAAQEPLFAPGEAQAYSNTDYILLGMVIENATGKTWREEVRQRIIEPLNLEDTLLPEPGDNSSPPDQAHGYVDLGDGLLDVTEAGVDPSMASASGGQALITTAEDLEQFLKALLAGELFQNAGTLDEMQTFVAWPDGNPLSPWITGYGLGIFKVVYPGGIEAIGHSGTAADFNAIVLYFPDQGITISGAVNFPDAIGCFDPLIQGALDILLE